MKIDIEGLDECFAKYCKKYDRFEAIFTGDAILTIKGIGNPKKQAIKDLGKAVNWFNSHWIWSERSDQYINTNGTIKNSFWYIRQVCFGKEELPEWWPDELTEQGDWYGW